MASGDTLLIFQPYNNSPPSGTYATLDTRNDHPVLDFDASTNESAVFSAVMPRFNKYSLASFPTLLPSNCFW